MKHCFKCEIVKPFSEFYKHKSMGDGHLGKCKECTKKDANKHRDENIEKARSYDRNRPNKDERCKQASKYHKHGKGKEIHLKANQDYRAKYPLKYKAKTTVSNYLRDGKLFRPDNCEKCNTKCKPQAHHDDYSKPIDVRWLCVRCHNDFHNGVREIFRNLEHTGLKNPFDDE